MQLGFGFNVPRTFSISLRTSAIGTAGWGMILSTGILTRIGTDDAENLAAFLRTKMSVNMGQP